MLSICPTCDAE